ncbi:MAG: hypothetical protein ACRD4T_14400, partial [Candidatus Acidiferrales bacterium]
APALAASPCSRGQPLLSRPAPALAASPCSRWALVLRRLRYLDGESEGTPGVKASGFDHRGRARQKRTAR